MKKRGQAQSAMINGMDLKKHYLKKVSLTDRIFTDHRSDHWYIKDAASTEKVDKL